MKKKLNSIIKTKLCDNSLFTESIEDDKEAKKRRYISFLVKQKTM